MQVGMLHPPPPSSLSPSSRSLSARNQTVKAGHRCARANIFSHFRRLATLPSPSNPYPKVCTQRHLVSKAQTSRNKRERCSLRERQHSQKEGRALHGGEVRHGLPTKIKCGMVAEIKRGVEEERTDERGRRQIGSAGRHLATRLPHSCSPFYRLVQVANKGELSEGGPIKARREIWSNAQGGTDSVAKRTHP